MIDMGAFADEYTKIAGKSSRSRKGAIPIHVHNLAKKLTYDKRTTKVASVEGKALGAAARTVAKKHVGKAGLIGGGILAWEAGKQAVNDYKVGRQYRKQMGQ